MVVVLHQAKCLQLQDCNVQQQLKNVPKDLMLSIFEHNSYLLLYG